MPSVRTASFGEPKPLTEPGGIVQTGGYMQRDINRMSRAPFVEPMRAAGVAPKKVMR